MIRRAKPLASAAAAVALAVAALLTGCGIDPAGIQDTSVVEAGLPATITTIPEQHGLVVYFVNARGRLTPVVKPGPFDGDEATHAPETGAESGGADGAGSTGSTDERYTFPVNLVLHMLFRGPTQADRAAGLGTRLPADASNHSTELTFDDDKVSLVLGFPVKPLSETARQQIVCTISRHTAELMPKTVVLSGPGGRTEPDVCRAPAL